MRKFILAATLNASLLTFAVCSIPAIADANADVAELMKKVRNDESLSFDAVNAAPPREVLAALRQYLNDSSPSVRYHVMAIAKGFVGSKSDPQLRAEAMELVLQSIESEPLQDLAANIINMKLVQLPRSAYSRGAKEIIARMMSRDDVLPEVVQLVGVANVNTAPVRQRLQQMAESPTSEEENAAEDAKLSIKAKRRERSNRRAKREARWALARLGDPAVIGELIARLDAETSEGGKLRPLQDLALTRQPEAVEVLVRYLFRDERLPNTVNDKYPGQKTAKFALNYLADMIEGFPRELIGGTDEDIAKARQWVIDQGGAANLRIKD